MRLHIYMRNILKLLLLAMMLVSTAAFGQTVQGAGLHSCGRWASERQVTDLPKIAYQQWVVGYLSAVNTWGKTKKDILKNVNNEKLYLWVDRYCRENSQKTIADAVTALTIELISSQK